MANESADPSAAKATRRTALALVGVMATSGIAAGWFALATVNNRRMRDLKPGPMDPLLGHITSETRFTCGLPGDCPPTLLARIRVLLESAGPDPGPGPWCLVVDGEGKTTQAHGKGASFSTNPPFLARLIAGKRPERALFWMASAGGLPDSAKRLAAAGFPKADDPAWVAEITGHPWLVWIEGQPGLWVGRMVVRPGTSGEAKRLDSFVEAGSPANLRHQHDGGDVLLGWDLPVER